MGSGILPSTSWTATSQIPGQLICAARGLSLFGDQLLGGLLHNCPTRPGLIGKTPDGWFVWREGSPSAEITSPATTWAFTGRCTHKCIQHSDGMGNRGKKALSWLLLLEGRAVPPSRACHPPSHLLTPLGDWTAAVGMGVGVGVGVPQGILLRLVL